jgi:2-methylisocitrate lyase-like PEP mutase family enzyme
MTFQQFHDLHRGPAPLRLANCWDAGSARVISSLGSPAIATTSAGMAWSLGYADGHKLPVAELLAAVQRIARVVTVPLSVDIEAGYSKDPTLVATLVMQLADLGVVGINIEDGRDAPTLLAAKIQAIKTATAKKSLPVFVNARTDVYLKGLVPETARSMEVLQRSEHYRNAGADGLFVPLLLNAGEIAEIAKQAQLPLNVMAHQSLPSVLQLQALGVRRLSAGAAMSQASWGTVSKLSQQLLNDDSFTALFEQAMPGAVLNQLFA